MVIEANSTVDGGEHFRNPNISFKDKLAKNNPHMVYSSYSNPVWKDTGEKEISSDEDKDGDVENDPKCPTIRLSKEQKTRMRAPWRQALIIKMFDRGIGYLQLKRRLKTKWSLKGDFSLINIGCDYYITRLTNMEDRHHILT